jgi:DnaD/phage-associated family protein
MFVSLAANYIIDISSEKYTNDKEGEVVEFSNETYFHINFEDPFTRVPNSILDNKNLSYQAIGVVTQILRFQNSNRHKIYAKTLISYRKDGRTRVENALNELIREGFVTRTEIRNEKGHIKGYRYDVFDTSQISPDVEKLQSDKPNVEKPDAEKPQSENQQHKRKYIKENILKDFSSNKDELLEEVIAFYKGNIANSYVISSYEQSEILRLYGNSKDLLLEAMKVAVRRNAKNLGYIEGITKKWLAANITTLEELEAYKLHFGKSTSMPNKSIANKGKNYTKTKFHNFEETFDKYTPEELEKLILESQKNKWS